jgi:hypothetical protein
MMFLAKNVDEEREEHDFFSKLGREEHDEHKELEGAVKKRGGGFIHGGGDSICGGGASGTDVLGVDPGRRRCGRRRFMRWLRAS